MAQFSLVETAGRHVGRLILAGAWLCVAIPVVIVIPLVAVREPPTGHSPASAWWLLVGGAAGTVSLALLVWVGTRLWRVVLAVRLTSEDDLILDGLLTARSIPIGDVTGLAGGDGSTPPPVLIVEHRHGTVSIPGDADSLRRIADAVGARDPHVALGAWARPTDSESQRPHPGQRDPDTVQFLFLGGRRAGWTLQVIAVAVMALTVGVTLVAFWDKLSDALGGAHGAPWGTTLAQLSGTLGTLAAIAAPFAAPVLAAVVSADGSVRFARLWRTLAITAGEITEISEPKRSRRPELVIKHAGGELRMAGERADLEGLVTELRALNPEVEVGPWNHLFAEDGAPVSD